MTFIPSDYYFVLVLGPISVLKETPHEVLNLTHHWAVVKRQQFFE
jgi:hypothetical protein